MLITSEDASAGLATGLAEEADDLRGFAGPDTEPVGGGGGERRCVVGEQFNFGSREEKPNTAGQDHEPFASGMGHLHRFGAGGAQHDLGGDGAGLLGRKR